MKDRIVLITGATGGIGKAAAIALARRGATVVVHGRDAHKTALVREEIVTLSGNKKVDTLVGDLFLMKNVEQLAAAFKKRYDRLDVLINNAGGVMDKQLQLTEEGLEKTFAVNLLTPLLLSQLLLAPLRQSEQGRIINVSSNSHALNAAPDFTDWQLKNSYSPLKAYGNTKLFLIWVSQHLAATLDKEDGNSITVNTMHPGAVRTGFGKGSDLGAVLNFLSKLARPFFRTPEQGADTLVYLATADEVAKISGKYFVDRKIAKVAAKYYSKEREQAVWDYCNSLVS